MTLDNILNEHGYELYWEGYRRQDLIRFDKFTEAWQEKPETDESKTLFPLPTSAIDVNENLKKAVFRTKAAFFIYQGIKIRGEPIINRRSLANMS